MSNSASLSAAKRRRGGVPPPLGQQPSPQMQTPPQHMGGNLPPGLPPNFRQMPPQLQQQILRQLQQRMMQAQAPAQAPQNILMSSNNMNEKVPAYGPGPGSGVGPTQVSGNGPYVVNSVLHSRAMSEIEGIHIRDLPMSAAGLPCLPSGAALPPNLLFKLHHDELLDQDATINDYSNRLQMLTNRVDKIERGGSASFNAAATNASTNNESSANDEPSSINGLVNNTDFIAKILDNILTNTNLSDIINQIEPLQKENETLRALISSQQTTLNELSTLVMKLLNGNLLFQPQTHDDGTSTANAVAAAADNFNVKYEDIKDEFCNYVNGVETGELNNINQVELSNVQDGVAQEQGQEQGQDEEEEQEQEQEEHEQDDTTNV